jgi:hypothetical protein
MRKTLCLSLLVLVGLILVSCQSGEGPGPDPIGPIPDPAVTVESAQLLIFSAPWCSPCHQLHKEFIPQYNADEELKAAVKVTVWVTTGNSSSQAPTQATADAYKAALKAPYEFLPDPWKWTTFKKYLGGSLAIPGGVVLDENGEVLQKFPPGTCSASALLKYLRQLISG